MAHASLGSITAMLEVYTSVEREAFDAEWTRVVAEIPDELVAELGSDDRPPDWDRLPHAVATHRHRLARARHLDRAARALHRARPPSWNVLVNPLHPDAHRIRIESRHVLELDARLLDRLPSDPSWHRHRTCPLRR